MLGLDILFVDGSGNKGINEPRFHIRAGTFQRRKRRLSCFGSGLAQVQRRIIGIACDEVQPTVFRLLGVFYQVKLYV